LCEKNSISKILLALVVNNASAGFLIVQFSNIMSHSCAVCSEFAGKWMRFVMSHFYHPSAFCP